ncbi:site-2 protease family protein [Saccharopolyspora sp. HNM0983]|uniref:Zinc metalloprotease n=1 Tax=Saccharopolyspora montiporae TaxID=2781240 RepID=A0A929FYM4_9PSEU|nr:site-2 protease family protein [Saccharopolyspora sp. HNM0983]MBE9375966.1 site-2 protease family protein [Saccharopolyspora sp. HNM0983]
MRATVPLGRIAGVRVGLHWSVAGIMLLVAVGLAAYQLPAVFPGHSAPGYALSGVLAAVLLMLSLLGHELAHAIVARRNGVRVAGITLWLLGGVARLQDEARTPGAEFRIAVVGPAVSALLGVVFGGAAWAAIQVGAGRLAAAVLLYLAVLNVALAVFNLVPAAPLDGGRVLRAGLWRWTRDRTTASVWSARAGQGLGGLLVAAGVVRAFTSGVDGVWWVLIGMFVLTIAGGEQRQARLGEKLAGIRVAEAMDRDVPTVDAGLTVDRFLRERVFERGPASFAVSNGNELLGVVGVRRARAVPQRARSTTTLARIATPLPEVGTAAPDEPLSAVMPRLAGADERVLVFDGAVLAGSITPAELDRAAGFTGPQATSGPSTPPPEDDRPPPPDWWYPGRG